jgi:hypothetical protein
MTAITKQPGVGDADQKMRADLVARAGCLDRHELQTVMMSTPRERNQ